MDETVLLTTQKYECAFMDGSLKNSRIVQDAELVNKLQLGREGIGALI